jgi:hypothetical protein
MGKERADVLAGWFNRCVPRSTIRCPECGNEFDVMDSVDPIPLHIYEGARCPGSGQPGLVVRAG